MPPKPSSSNTRSSGEGGGGGGQGPGGGGGTSSDRIHEDPRVRLRMESYREDASLRHICEVNGVTEEVFAKKVETVDTLEIFMTIPVALNSLHDFTGLRTLRVIKQPDVKAVAGLDDAKKLEALWICECSLESTLHLDKCLRLEKLFLTSNRILQVEQLNTLTNLQQLWLNDNRLTSLAGLESLVNLRELWAARNHIQRIGSSLSKCTSLTDLNLANNKIGCFKEVLNLRNLERLRSLALTDPHFGINPVANLCNYQTLVIFHLTQLTQLDMRTVSDKSKHMAQSIFLKKRMYYNMRIRTLKRNAGNLILLAESYLKVKTHGLLESFSEVMKQLKNCEYSLEEMASEQRQGGAVDPSNTTSSSVGMPQQPSAIHQPASATVLGGYARSGGRCPPGSNRQHQAPAADSAEAPSAAWQQLDDRRRTLGKVAGVIENRLAAMDMSLDVARDAVHHVAGRMIKNLMMEFNTGGNIRLEEGSEKEAWYSNFRNFVQSSFHAADFEPFGICEVDVNRIIKLHNRLLRQRFDARIKEVIKKVNQEQQQQQQQQPSQGGGSSPKNSSSNSNAGVATGGGGRSRFKSSMAVEYLFMRISESMMDNLEEYISRIAEEGFPVDEKPGPGIRLSTTVWDADYERLRMRSREVRPGGVREVTDSGLVGRLLVVKIYRGKCLEIETKEEEFARLYGTSGGGISAATFPGYQSLSIRFTDRTGPRQWYMLDPTLVVPEFIVDFDYMRKVDREGLLMTTTLNGGGGSSTMAADNASVEERLQSLFREVGSEQEVSLLKAAEEQVMDLRPFSLPILRFTRKVTLLLNSYHRLHLSEQQQPSHHLIAAKEPLRVITEAELFRFTRVGNLSSLTHLNLHNQGIERIENLSGCKQLRKLVLSFNSIGRMEALEELQGLEWLDLSFNHIKKLEAVSGLHRLCVLKLQSNCIDKFDDHEYVRACLPKLADLTIRHNPVSRVRNGRLQFLRAFLTLEVLDGVKVTERERSELQEHSRVLSLDQIRKFASKSRTNAQQMQHGGGNCGLPVLNADLDVWKRVMQHEPPSSSLVPSAPPAASTPPVVVVVQQPKEAAGLSWIDGVEELYIDTEGIQKLQHLDKLPNLRRASFAHNDILSMEGLQGCTALEDLSLEDNQITQIDYLDPCTRLKKLDLGSNSITSLLRLKALVNLTQLSLENNEISSLAGVECLSSLMELYLANNLVAKTAELDSLRNTSRLIILDLSGNPICQTNHYRTYTVYRLRWLKVLDGKPVTSREMGDSHKIFEGKLTYDNLLEKIRPARYEDLQELDLSGCRLKDVDILGAGDLEKLRELVLDNNQLTHFQWTKGLTSLTFLSLNHNRIEGFPPPGQSSRHTVVKDNFLAPSGSLPELEILSLNNNRIIDLRDLELYHLPNLTVLHAHNNDITQVAGLHHCTLLRELVLDQNKIRQVDAPSFCGLTSLREVRMEGNGLRSLTHFGKLTNLQVLYLGNNRISELMELEKLGDSDIRELMDVNLTGNPVCRKPRYRNYLISIFPSLHLLDGKTVTDDERDRMGPLTVDSGVMKRYFTDIQLPLNTTLNKPPQGMIKLASVNMSDNLRFGTLQDAPFPVAEHSAAATITTSITTTITTTTNNSNHTIRPRPNDAPAPSLAPSPLPPSNTTRKLERTSSASSFARARRGNQDVIMPVSTRPR